MTDLSHKMEVIKWKMKLISIVLLTIIADNTPYGR